MLSAYCVPGTDCALCHQTLPTAVCKLRTIIIIRAKIYQLIHAYAYVSWVSLQLPLYKRENWGPGSEATELRWHCGGVRAIWLFFPWFPALGKKKLFQRWWCPRATPDKPSQGWALLEVLSLGASSYEALQQTRSTSFINLFAKRGEWGLEKPSDLSQDTQHEHQSQDLKEPRFLGSQMHSLV